MPRYQPIKYEYTADDDTTFIRSQRLFKDSNGNLILPIPNFLQERIVSNTRSKNAIWGKGNSNLRKAVIRYANENNTESQQTIVIPQNANQQMIDSLKELKNICDETFSPLSYCFNYRGETRS